MSSNQPDPIVAELRQARIRSGWSQAEVGRRLGKLLDDQVGDRSQQMICSWETGAIVPSLPMLRAWAAIFGKEIVVNDL